MDLLPAFRSPAGRVQLAALAVATVAVLVRWYLGGLTILPVPPGVILLAGAAITLLVVRRPLAVPIALGATVLVAAQLGYRVSPRQLSGAGGGALASALWLQIAAVAVALVAGVLAVVQDQRRRRASQPSGPTDHARTAQVVGLLVLAPICAEYLAAYDDSTGHPLQLLLGLTIFVPLYGCAALLIREVARRFDLGWVGILLLGVAFGLFEAGVVDQSLFSQDYREIEGWEAGFAATLIAPLGISAANAVNFVFGHAIFSIAAPIGMVEAARPASAHRPWLGRRGLLVVAAVYAAGSALVLREHLTTEASHASTGQVIGSLLLIAGLVALAVRLGRRTRPPVTRRAPRPRTVFAAVLVLAIVQNFAAEDWGGIVLTVVTSVIAGLGVAYAARRFGWGVRHIAAACAAPLVVRALWAFTYPPVIGQVSDAAKYTHNAVFLVLILALTVLALRRQAEGVSQSPTTLSSGSRK